MRKEMLIWKGGSSATVGKKTRRSFFKDVLLGSAALSVAPRISSAGKPADSKTRRRKPNIVYIMVDDLGKEWISCYGAEEIETPQIDKLAESGMKFDNFYCMPQCTPTRLSFLTGQYPCNHGFVNHWDVPRWGGGCHFDPGVLPSIGKVMKAAGYKTAVAGKWQIDDFRVEPEACQTAGFDEYCMWTGGEGGNRKSDSRYWNPYIHTKNGSRTYEGEFGPDNYTDFLLDFMKKNKDDPMFVYFPMCLPHTPLVTTPLKPTAKGSKEKHIAMVEYIDYLTGRIVETLEQLGIRENTIIFWTSDNGSSTPGRRNGVNINAGKGRTVEQGVNVPFIANCPGTIPQGLVSEALADVTDILPTCAELANAPLPATYKNDGRSIADVLLGETQYSERNWIMAMGGHNNAKMTDSGPENQWYWRDRVIRDRRYKLYVGTDKKAKKLFDLAKDPWEENNIISSSDPQAKSALQKLHDAIYQFPQKDNDFVCRPNPPQAWDRKIQAKSEIWKMGRPGDQHR